MQKRVYFCGGLWFNVVSVRVTGVPRNKGD